MLFKMEETCQVIQSEAKKPVNVNWSPIFTEFSENISPSIIKTLVQSQEETVRHFKEQMSTQLAGAWKILRGKKPC
jgi:hypothetical protein